MACHALRFTEFLMNRTLPSVNRMLTPPGCRLRAVRQPCYADVNLSHGFGRNHVRACASVDYAGIHRKAALQIGKVCYVEQLPGEFHNRAVALLEIHSCMRSATAHSQAKIAHAFARRL